MKKFAALFIALVMVLAVFASCQTNDVKPGGDTTVPKQTDDRTTTNAPETVPKPVDETTKRQEETTEDENALPTVRTIYSNDNRSKLQLLDHGVDGKIVNKLVQGKGFMVDGTIDEDGKAEALIADWDKITVDAHTTNDGEHTYFPFIGFTREITINEFVIGDLISWLGNDENGNPKWTLFTDYDRLAVWYTDNPNGTWSKWDCTCEPFENPDNGILFGTFDQGLSFKGGDVTARYFMVYYPDPQINEIYFNSNNAAPAAIYNPPAAD